MKPVEERIDVFKQLLCCLDSAYLTEYGADFSVRYSSAPHPDVMVAFYALGMQEQDPEKFLYRETDLSHMRVRPVVVSNALGMVWISDAWILRGKVERIFVLGPVFLDDYSLRDIEHQLTSYDLSVSLKKNFLGYIRQLPVVALNRFYEHGLMLHYCIWEEKISVSDLTYADMKKYPKQEVWREVRHGTYGAEREVLRQVENGNLEYEQALHHALSAGELGRMGDGTYLRQEKNTVIMFTTLCSRAAIKGGLPSETAFCLCDLYVRKVEEAEDLSALTQVRRKMYHDFVLRVHRQKLNEHKISPQIKRACDYMELHVNDKADIHSLAKYLGYSDYYFSSLFKKETGMSVREYSMRVKVESAKIYLKESGKTMAEISEELGFSSQSYFGEVFRELEGISPMEYRQRNSVGKKNENDINL